MNGTNRKLLYAMAAVASVYLLLTLLYSIAGILDSGEYCVRMFSVSAAVSGVLAGATDPTNWYLDLGLALPPDFVSSFNSLLDAVFWTPLAAVPQVPAYVWKAVFAAVGFVLTLCSLFSKYGGRASGSADDPQEYLITHRPFAPLMMLLIPWNIFRSTWHYHHVPVIIPIVLLPFLLPYALLAEIPVIIVFLIEELAVRIWVYRAAQKDEAEYTEEVGWGVCPYCRAKFKRPRVVCSVCKLEMNYPVPGPHGVNYHTCNNGHRLPSTNRDGVRGRLDAVCPRCGKRIKTHEAKPLVFAMVGAVGAGKSTLMLAAAENLCDVANRRGLSTEALTPGISKQVQADRARVAPTKPGELGSECLFVRSRDLHERELVFNDISGQEFEADEDRNYFEEYYQYCHGLVFVIDPADVSAVFNSRSPTKGTKTTPETVFDSFFQLFTTINRAGPSTVSDVPLAIVLSKTGLPAAAAALGRKTPEQFLRDCGQGGFVDNAAAAFRNVRYFKADALKDDSEAAAPFRWILETADPQLNAKLTASAVPQK
ncbi:MAG: hypothetical protein WCQ63_05540 [Methanomethylophilus sp.]